MLKTASACVRAAEARLGDRLLNIHSGGPVHFKEKRGAHSDAFDFEPGAHIGILKAIRLLSLSASDCVYVLGAGKGRTVCHFARHGVRKVVGIEIEPALCEVCRKNVETLRCRRSPVDILNVDAATCDFSDGTVFFMFNPFGPETLRHVLKNIGLHADSRPIRIVYMNALFPQVFGEFNWIEVEADYRKLVSGQRVIIYRNRLSREKRPGN